MQQNSALECQCHDSKGCCCSSRALCCSAFATLHGHCLPLSGKMQRTALSPQVTRILSLLQLQQCQGHLPCIALSVGTKASVQRDPGPEYAHQTAYWQKGTFYTQPTALWPLQCT